MKSDMDGKRERGREKERWREEEKEEVAAVGRFGCTMPRLNSLNRKSAPWDPTR